MVDMSEVYIQNEVDPASNYDKALFLGKFILTNTRNVRGNIPLTQPEIERLAAEPEKLEGLVGDLEMMYGVIDRVIQRGTQDNDD